MLPLFSHFKPTTAAAADHSIPNIPVVAYIITAPTYHNNKHHRHNNIYNHSYNRNDTPFWPLSLLSPGGLTFGDLDTYWNGVMANGYSVFIGLAICVTIAVVGYIFAPKGETQTLWRSSIILTMACTYLMWVLTLLSQLNPLVQPYATDFRKEYIE